ncbi:MAG: hypothetical protein JWN37_743 [Candidatus Nomurabacteria bacterium]|nr:hypothetical protein [Candidatus Nomurabacteria bacterium]
MYLLYHNFTYYLISCRTRLLVGVVPRELKGSWPQGVLVKITSYVGDTTTQSGIVGALKDSTLNTAHAGLTMGYNQLSEKIKKMVQHCSISPYVANAANYRATCSIKVKLLYMAGLPGAIIKREPEVDFGLAQEEVSEERVAAEFKRAVESVLQCEIDAHRRNGDTLFIDLHGVQQLAS